MKITKLLIVLSLGVIGLAACERKQSNDDVQVKLDVAIENERQALEKELGGDIPSISVLIETPKGKYFTSSAGKNGKVITDTTNFRFASSTKNFTSAALLNMAQDGWVKLDDKITALIPGKNIPYVPDTKEWDFPNKKDITIRMLLQHNAGVYDLTNDASQYNIGGETYMENVLKAEPNHQFSTAEYISVLAQHKSTYGPVNTVYHYSNTGYSILGEIIGRVYSLHAGKTVVYKDYLYDKITGPKAKVPLKVRFIDDANDQLLPEPYVTGMIREKDKTVITDRENASGNVAEGNGVGSMAELNKYIRSLMKGKNVLKPEMIAQMKNSVGPAPQAAGSHYGLGCFKLKNLGYGHNGATTGYLSLMMYDPETDISVISVLPYWDFSKDDSFPRCIQAINNAGLAARTALGYPGK